jgi:transposase-like protein
MNTSAASYENSHLPLRKRARMMQGFRSPGSLRRFVAIFSAFRNLFVRPIQTIRLIYLTVSKPSRNGTPTAGLA